MQHSNSSLNTFNRCMHLYKMIYIDELEPDTPSLDFEFGKLGHEILCNAGNMRDAGKPDEQYSMIPGELEYEGLKEKYGINSWMSYFKDVIDECRRCEEEAIARAFGNETVSIEREKKIILMPEHLHWTVKNPIVGVVDCLIYTRKKAVILDYKFSSRRKTQDDFDENSQLQLYARLVTEEYDIDENDVMIGYIDIPKKAYDMPALLKNGTLSKAKSQNVSAQNYLIGIKAAHGENDPYYNANPGGYYYDIVQELSLNRPAYMSLRMLDIDVYRHILSDINETITLIELLDTKGENLYPRMYSSYLCDSCEYKKQCKPWLTVDINTEE